MQRHLSSILLILIFLSGSQINAQKSFAFFELKGNINSSNGKIFLTPVGDSAFYKNGGYYETSIKNGLFSFKGHLLYPHAFRIRVEIDSQLKYMSDIFFVDPGNQSIVCNIDSAWEIPKVVNKSMNELNIKYNPTLIEEQNKLEALNIVRDSLSLLNKNNRDGSVEVAMIDKRVTLEEKQNVNLLNYIRSNPASYVGFWMLIDRWDAEGFNVLFDSAFNSFSKTLKDTYLGKAMFKKLRSSKAISIGSIFPLLELRNTKDEKVALKKFTNNRYTLIDFWFSHCGPCIAEFPALKELYANYKHKGFNIIGISVDKENYEDDWHKAIKTHGLVWEQLLDKNGKNAERIFINSYPTTFLLDNKGRIIKRKINASQLKEFLDKNLQDL